MESRTGVEHQSPPGHRSGQGGTRAVTGRIGQLETQLAEGLRKERGSLTSVDTPPSRVHAAVGDRSLAGNQVTGPRRVEETVQVSGNVDRKQGSEETQGRYSSAGFIRVIMEEIDCQEPAEDQSQTEASESGGTADQRRFRGQVRRARF